MPWWKGTKHGVKEVFIGMAHRGRLSTLAHILGKPYEEIFCIRRKAYDEGANSMVTSSTTSATRAP